MRGLLNFSTPVFKPCLLRKFRTMDTRQQDYFKGRGAQLNTKNKFLKQAYVTEHIEGLDEPLLEHTATQYFEDHPKKIVNKIDSPDLHLVHSLNPYQGCEHGCIYCYARNAHEYYGFSAGLDFERKIIIKRNAPDLLIQHFENPKWEAYPITLSGNTDCYQPIERKLKLTRRLLEVFLKYKNPVGIITKNSLILRDLDIISELAALNLIHVNVSVTTLNEDLRQQMEPRTVTGLGRLKVIRELSDKGVPVRVMNAPILPGLNSDEIPSILKAAADNGARAAAMTMVRLNGAIGEVFTDWIQQAYPDRAEKVLNLIRSCHGGTLNDSRWGVRMRGDGHIAESIHNIFRISVQKHFKGRSMPEYDCTLFKRPRTQLALF